MGLNDSTVSVLSEVVLKLGDDVSTDAIFPGRFLATVLPEETPQYAFADCPEFNARLRTKKISPGSVVAAGYNFGCGSSREQAASTLKGHDLVIIARSYARIFMQNAVNLGLRILICPEFDVREGDLLELSADRIINTNTKSVYMLEPLPQARRAIIEAGGLIPYTRARLVRKFPCKGTGLQTRPMCSRPALESRPHMFDSKK
jgi:3-isopropylmalate/(R)-2-methylmalate dehydratase small subunit